MNGERNFHKIFFNSTFAKIAKMKKFLLPQVKL